MLRVDSRLGPHILVLKQVVLGLVSYSDDLLLSNLLLLLRVDFHVSS